MESIVRKRNNAELQFVIETPLRETVVVDTVPKCEAAIKQIMADCSVHKAVGFDCEWIGTKHFSKYGKVLLISMCTPKGYCALFRLNKFREMPQSLIDFLGNESYTKAGVGTLSVVNNLWNDYRITVTEWFELRWTAMLRKDELEQRYGSRLQHIAHHLHNIVMYRDMPDFDMRNFEADELSPESISFAAADVHSFIETYKLFHPFHPIA